jgi:hypothetical protein
MSGATANTHGVKAQGPMHIAPIAAQLPYVMAMDPMRTQTTSANTVIMRHKRVRT